MDSWDSLIAALRQWEWIGKLLARLAVGFLFVLSGSGKLFVPTRRQTMVETLRAAKIPRPEINAAVASLVEFVFGAFLVIGFLTPLSCFMLICVMIGALITTVVPSIKAQSLFGWVGDFLYQPEVLYVVILVWLFFSGPGWLSTDEKFFFGGR
jgi:putative oxidoreductase